MKQQTAVEWLIDNLPTRFKNALINECSQEIEQTKQMEKEQIVNAHGDKYDGAIDEVITGEQYYNETYTTFHNK